MDTALAKLRKTAASAVPTVRQIQHRAIKSTPCIQTVLTHKKLLAEALFLLGPDNVSFWRGKIEDNLVITQAKHPGQTKQHSSCAAVQLRRNKLSNRLWKQIQLATAQQIATEFAPMRTRSYKDT